MTGESSELSLLSSDDINAQLMVIGHLLMELRDNSGDTVSNMTLEDLASDVSRIVDILQELVSDVVSLQSAVEELGSDVDSIQSSVFNIELSAD
ncbi:hypothetical protein [Kineosporia babensis]|uniref:Uncharacterized protein n=1 Tax=Kineosporia babensis TaxID=499548 RepID=A0A9X1NBN8_9ACTN|nr:hypothetical protein [Kineosporia babensis]MCD5310759.1 hypothetical protein [Kineosporia babensis]